MTKHVFFSICFALFICFTACKNLSVDSGDELLVIDLQDFQKGKYENVSVEQLAKDSRVIPLETTEASIFRFGDMIHSVGDHLYVQGANSFLLFDNEGHFIGTIGKKGEGPEEYIYPDVVFFQDDLLNIYDKRRERILRFNKEDQLTGIIPAPKDLHAIYPVGDKYIGFITNLVGTETDHFVLFDRQGEVVDRISYPHPEQEANQIIAVFYDEGVFFEGNGHLNFKELFNDTLYVVQDFTFVPRIFFELGEKRANPNARRELIDPRSSVLGNMQPVTVLGESGRFLFLEMGRNEIAAFDKKEKQIRLLTWEGKDAEDVQTNVRIRQQGKETFLILQTDDLETEDNPALSIYTLL